MNVIFALFAHSMVRVGFLTVALACTICLTETGRAQQPVNYGPAEREMFHQAITQIDVPASIRQRLNGTDADVQNWIRAQVDANFPIFIFIPGIMGSKLTKGSDVIWGQYNLPPLSLAYDARDDIATDLLEEFKARVRGREFSLKNVYKPAIDTVRELNASYGTRLLLFPYDWRGSNLESAKKLASWICERQQTLSARPVVFLAHSMGGLVLKHWLMNSLSANCTSGQSPVNWLRIKAIVFAGTPHFGAPDSLSAFSENMYLFFDRKNIYWFADLAKWTGIARGFDPANPVNNYGATFPSIYELLPVVGEDCFPGQRKPTVLLDRLDGTKSNVVNVFDAPFWKDMNWPHTIPDVLAPDTFHKIKLPDQLKSARSLLCNLAKYNDDSVKKVMKDVQILRVYGRGHETSCGIKISEQSWPWRKVKIERQLCKGDGDGTVPVWIATEDSVPDRIPASDANRSNFLPIDTKGHQELYEADELKNFIRDYHKELHRRWQETVYTALDRTDDAIALLGDLYCKAKWIVPSPPDQTAKGSATGADAPSPPPRSEDVPLAKRIAASAAVKCDVTAAKVKAAANAKPKNTADRADALRVYADMAPNNPWNTAWALSNSAHINLRKNNYAAALDLAKLALQKANELQGPQTREIKGKAAWTAALAARELNDDVAKKSYCAIATQNGYRGQTHICQ